MCKKLIFTIVFFVQFVIKAYSQVSGIVFRDFNFNGARTTSNPSEPLIGGIIVNAYNSANQIIASYTTGNGSGAYPFTGPNYSIPASGSAYNGTQGSNTGFIPSGTQIRLEFITSASCHLDPSSKQGVNNGTSIQFLAAPSTSASFAVSNPSDYNTGTASSSLFIPQYVNGDPLGGGTSGSGTWFSGFPYSNTGTILPAQTLNGTTIGACWGVAYSKQAKKVFTSAFIKRHVGLGQMGVGGIYMLTPTASSFTVTQFFDMDNNSFNTASNPVTRVSAAGLAGAPAYGAGSSYSLNAGNSEATYLGSNDPLTGKPAGFGVVGTNVQRGLLSATTTSSYDPAAFDQVGKVGIGDIDISDDGKYLFVMNMYQRKVFRLELNDAYNPTSVISVTSYTLPSVTVTNGELRPWATKFYKGKLYVGSVASGENGITNSTANLNAYIFELNNATGAASFNPTPVLNYPLNYTKGRNISTSTTTGHWFAWTSNVNNINLQFGGVMASTPILSDIDINERGDLIMAFTDRTGHQFYSNNAFLLGGSTTIASVTIGGDILIAGKNCSTGFTLENNGSINSNSATFTTNSLFNSEGPGNAEFFNGDFFGSLSVGQHMEIGQGAMAILLGSNEVAMTAMDPLDFNSGGIRKLSTLNGSGISSYQLYFSASGTAAKGNGLGDIELITPLQPIEIGNRIWQDTNANGIQDAGETTAGVPAGTTVTLHSPGLDGIYGNADDQTWTTTTDANGNYYFSILSSSDNRRTDSMVANDIYTNQLIPDLDYRIEVATPSGKAVTTTDTGSNGSDTIDSDATASGNLAIINFNTNITNHTYDIGFSDPPPPMSLGSTAFIDLNNDGIQSGAGETGISGLTVSLFAADGTTPILDGSGNPITTTTNAQGDYVFNNLAPGTYVVGMSAPANYPTASSVVTAGTDGSNNGTQAGGSGTISKSAPIVLTLGSAPTGETGQGAGLTTSADNNTNSTVDFGFFAPPMSLGSTAFIDLNNDGIQSGAGETGISGLTVSLFAADGTTPILDGSGNPITTTTNAQGDYVFNNLAPGTYVVGMSAPANYPTASSVVTAGTDGSNNGTQAGGSGTISKSAPIVLTLGSAPTGETGQGAGLTTSADNNTNSTVDFGFFAPPMSLGSTAFIDLNNDGIQSGAGETIYPGLTVSLFAADGTTPILDGSGNPITTTTNAQGDYVFNNLAPGTYVVGMSAPANYPTASSVVTAGTDGSNNGTQAGGSGTISKSAPIVLTLGSAPTGETGQGAGLTTSADNNTNSTVDFGFFAPPMSLGSTAFIDLNNDGIQSGAGETGISGLTVSLFAADGTTPILDGSGNPITTTTNAQGDYVFNNLAPGTYVVGMSAPANYPTASSVVTAGTDGSNNGTQAGGSGTISKSAPIVLTLGSAPTGETGQGAGLTTSADNNTNSTVDFGFFAPPMSLGSTAFIDLNNDGIQSGAGETGISGLTVSLFAADGTTPILDGSGNPITTTTNAQGDYVFNNLAPGTYVVGMSAPANYPTASSVVTAGTDGSNNGTQAGGSGTISKSAPIVLTLGSAPTGETGQGAGLTTSADNNTNSTVDFGFFDFRLPVSLLQFEGKQLKEQIILNWKTSNESNFSHFEVEKSADSKEFGSIGKVMGSHEVFYNAIDSNPVKGNNYYRLKMVDLNGNFTLSSLIQVNYENEGSYVSVENPAENGKITVMTNLRNPRFTLLSSLGANITIDINEVSKTSYLINLRKVVAGMYYLNIESNGKFQTKKVLIP